MSVTPEAMLTWCQNLLNVGTQPSLPLRDYLDSIPRLGFLGDLPAGTPVLVRGDVDAKPGKEVGKGDIRLRSMVETLQYGRAKGWKQVIFGHIGRDKTLSLDKVAARLGQLLGCEVTLLTDWLDEATLTIRESVPHAIAQAANGSVLILQTTRAYDIETVLWEKKPEDLPALVGNLAKIANEYATKVARFYVNEALSAGSLDTSSTIVPAAMERSVLGRYQSQQFEEPMMRCLQAQLVVFSGIKIDKLDDLEAMIARGTVRTVLSAGSLALALKKADADLAGKPFSLGKSGNKEFEAKDWFIAADRIEQAKRILKNGRAKGITFVLPVDFVLENKSTVSVLGETDQQFDIGPESSKVYAQAIDQFIAGAKPGAVAFHNGVFGMFEKEEFSHGTKNFIPLLKKMKDAGIEVYVGGGEGGKALEEYGKPDWVTHTFTAGGTVLNALGANPVPYLVALRLAQL